MKVIITKYATSSGIQIREGDISAFAKLFRCNDGRLGYHQCFGGNDWHPNSTQAIEDVEARFSRKRASLELQLKALDEKRAKAINAIQASGL